MTRDQSECPHGALNMMGREVSGGGPGKTAGPEETSDHPHSGSPSGTI